jgi:hypothetical protein
MKNLVSQKQISMSREKEIKKNNPEADESLLELARQFDENHDLKVLHDTNGGKLLVRLLVQDIIGTMNRIAANRATYTLSDFQAAGSDIETKLNIVRALIRAEDNEEYLNELLAENLAV